MKKHKQSDDNTSPEKIKPQDYLINGTTVSGMIKSQEPEKSRTTIKVKDKDNVISNTLNFNIPLRLKIEINRSEKCSKIIEYLKGFSELNLEKNENYTEFVMFSKDNYIEQDMKIDDTFLNNSKISIYECLTFLTVF